MKRSNSLPGIVAPIAGAEDPNPPNDAPPKPAAALVVAVLKPNDGADVAAVKPPKLVPAGCVEFVAPNTGADVVVVLKPKAGANVAAGAPNTSENIMEKAKFELKVIYLNGVNELIPVHRTTYEQYCIYKIGTLTQKRNIR